MKKSKRPPVKALASTVIVERRKFTEPDVAGAVIIPEAMKEPLTENIVFSIGKDVKLDIKVGDKVFISKYGGTPILGYDIDLYVISADAVEAIWTGK